MSWGALFNRATEFEVTEPAIAKERGDVTRRTGGQAETGDAERQTTQETESPTTESEHGEGVRVVADTGVLAGDLLLGNASRAVLDEVRGHHWVVLVASDELLAVTREIIAALTTTTLADDWHEQIRRERVSVSHPPGDHPALASAYRGNARHLVTTNEELTATGMNLSVQSHMELSIRPPDAFQTLFEPESLYEGLFEEAYPGPDRDPRA